MNIRSRLCVVGHGNWLAAIPGAFLASHALADSLVWQEPVSGDFNDRQRWLVANSFPEQRRAPGAGDDIQIITGPPITVNVTSAAVASADIGETVTLALNGSLAVAGELEGAPIIQGKGTLTAAHWRVGAPSPALSGVTAELGSFSLTGGGFGLMVLGGGSLKTGQYNAPQARGRVPLLVDGAGSSWTLGSDLKELEAPGLEVTLRGGATATLANVERAGFFFVEAGSKLTAGTFQPRHVAVRGGLLNTGEARPLGFGLGSGYGPAEVQGGTWNVGGKLTVPGVGAAVVLRLRGGGKIQTQELDVVDSAQVEIGTRPIEQGVGEGSSDGVVSVSGHCFKDRGTILLRDGDLFCGSLDFRGEGSLQGQNGLEVSGGFIRAETHAVFDTRASLKGGRISAKTAVIGGSQGRSGQLQAETCGLDFRESLIMGDAGVGSLVTLRPFGIPVDAPSIILGASPTGVGSFEVSGSILENQPWDLKGTMTIGDAGQGTFTLRDSEADFLSATAIRIAKQPGSRGTVRVLGTEARWTVGLFGLEGTLVVGERGQGALVVEGGHVGAHEIAIGRSTEESSCVVSGPLPAGSFTHNLSALQITVGDAGRGTLSVDQGGSVNASFVIVGRQSKSVSKIAVGESGTLFGHQGITVGEDGVGELQVAGEALTNRAVRIGKGKQAEGQVTLRGQGARLRSTSGGLEMGGGPQSKAFLTLLNGGEVRVHDLTAPIPPSGQADISVTGVGSELIVDRNMRLGRIGQASGPITCIFTGGSFGRIGRELLLRKNALITIGGAAVLVGQGNLPSPGNLLMRAGGRLAGDGRVKGRVFAENGGQISPGAALGTLTIDGDASLLPGSVLVMEISGPTAPNGHDFLHVTGSLRVQGTVELRFLNGYAPKAGERYCFTQADGGLTFTPSEIVVTGLAPGFAYDVSTDGAQFCLVARSSSQAASEPALQVEPGTDNNLSVSWTAENWRLESSADLSTWRPVATPAASEGGFAIELPPTGQGFFRLRR